MGRRRASSLVEGLEGPDPLTLDNEVVAESSRPRGMPALDHPHFGRGIRPTARIVVGPPDHRAHPAVAGRPVQALCQTSRPTEPLTPHRGRRMHVTGRWRIHGSRRRKGGSPTADREPGETREAGGEISTVSPRRNGGQPTAGTPLASGRHPGHVADGGFLRSSSASRPRLPLSPAGLRQIYARSGSELMVRSFCQCPSETKSTTPPTTVIAVWSSIAYAAFGMPVAHRSASARELPGMPSAAR